MKVIFGFFFLLICLSGCKSSTKISKSWRDPATQIRQGHFNKLLVVAFVKDPVNRKIVEDEMVRTLNNRAVASYQYLGENETSITGEDIAKRLQADGIDGAVVMQLVDPGRNKGYSPDSGTNPNQPDSFYPYYQQAGNNYRGREYLQNLNTYAVETNVYALSDNKLIWSGITRSNDPKNINKLVSSIGKVVISEMKKQGFLY